MRIVYGVFGYGRGHATRSAAVLPALMERHEVTVFAGRDAEELLGGTFACRPLPTIGYEYDARGRVSHALMVRRSGGLMADLLARGPRLRALTREIAALKPDVIVSDSEPWTHHAAAHLGIPRIGFDHVGVLAYCRFRPQPGDWLQQWRDIALYHLLMGRPERVIVSSFYHGPPRRDDLALVGPVLRDAVLQTPARDGEHVLAYFNKGHHQYRPQHAVALRTLSLPVLVYGTGRSGEDGNLVYRPRAMQPFLDDLASAHAVVGTSGHQMIAECLYFNKPLLTVPEDSVEQRLNAAHLVRMGLGARATWDQLNTSTLAGFLDRRDEFAESLAAHDGGDARAEALGLLEQGLAEVAGA